MSHHTSPIAARLLLVLTVLPTALLVPTGAAADTAAPSTKAQIEHAERQSAPAAANKAQVERDERTATTGRAGATVTGRDAGTTTTVPVPGGGDAAAWQLAASAAVGAVVAGGVLVTSRRFVEHRRPLAS